MHLRRSVVEAAFGAEALLAGRLVVAAVERMVALLRSHQSQFTSHVLNELKFVV